ncbi:hypothetical protein [Streptomyces sp. NBC_00525]|uniref:hypothetical protein n=1 Tax=Streptomyces sp. NBC_00525 TaxID=2903660 RepID=UPI002E80DD5D|nr:hypothetical protein [Streptomyces sp. NBC_00525]WUC94368.1 hypothetical protein OG710_12555 [Streptomyces sp. NBC_00525]
MSRRKTTKQKKAVHILTAYGAEVKEHQRKLKKRGFALAAEDMPPTGQAAEWYHDVIHYVPRSGMLVARQIARLAGEDSEVTIPWRSLADAVGVLDKAGRHIAYAQRGVKALVDAGWLSVKTTGKGCNAKTTFHLEAGDLYDWTHVGSEGDSLEED